MRNNNIFVSNYKKITCDPEISDLVVLKTIFAYIEFYGHRHTKTNLLLELILKQRSYLYEAILPFFENELEWEKRCLEYEINKEANREAAIASVIAFGILEDALEKYAPA